MSFLATAEEVAREAGALLCERFQSEVKSFGKREFDLVTDADFAAEELIVRKLRSGFPSHDILAEESGGTGSGADYRWLVDPLDGTKNFVRRHPAFSVTIALQYQKQTVCGVIFDPLRDEAFCAERGAGAFRNGDRVRVSSTARLADALITTGFPSAKRHRFLNPHMFHKVAMATQGYRRTGSTALDLAYVACGRLDAFWELYAEQWDIAAGLLLIEEAGGRCSDLFGGEYTAEAPHVLADNGVLHMELIELFGDIWKEPFGMRTTGA